MKKLTLLVAFVAITFVTSAQQGSWYIGGVAGLSSSTEEEPDGFKTTSTDWAFGPEVGTFLKDDIQLGIFLGIVGGSTKDDDGDIYEYSAVNPTIYSRKFFSITDNFSTFAGLYVNIGSGSVTDHSSGSSIEQKVSGFGVNLGIGVAYALSPRFTAVGQYGVLGYSTLNYKVEGEDAGKESSFNFGVNTVGYSLLGQGNGSGAVFNIGIYYTLKQ